MALELFNTLKGKKERFRTAEPGRARVYVCGPTVYDYAHIGHARACIVYDVLVRHLRATGTTVDYVRNITDIDDKILKRSKESNEDAAALAARFADYYHEDMERLHNLKPDVEPKVSEHLDEILALITRLIEGGHAYQADGDVYFSVESFPDYGKLSHRNLANLSAGASGRTDEAEVARKRHAADFALWKKSEADEPGWDSPFGRGRPGWHIECSAMSMRYLGESFDLHGGGLDLVFPHHENELAQSEAATGKPFVTMWMHNGFVEVDKQKMSKSLGNFFTVRELFERVEPEAIRFVMLSRHYRAPLNLDWTIDEDGHITGFPQFEEAEGRLEYLYATRRRLADIPAGRIKESNAGVPPEIANLGADLAKILDDDMNFPVALARTSEFLKAVNEVVDGAMAKKGKAGRSTVDAANAGFAALGEVLAIGTEDPALFLTRIRDRRARAHGLDPKTVEVKIEERTKARADKDFAKADAVRDELASLGVELHDGPSGTTWSMG